MTPQPSTRRSFFGRSFFATGLAASGVLALAACTRSGSVATPGAPAPALSGFYTSLAAIQGVLAGLPSSPAALIAEYKTQINASIASYNEAEMLFQFTVAAGAAATPASLAMLVASATQELLNLIALFTGRLGQTGSVASGQIRAHQIDGQRRPQAISAISFTDILTYLNLAAGVAAAVPGAAPYALLAQLIIRLVQSATAGVQAAQASYNPALLHTAALLP